MPDYAHEKAEAALQALDATATDSQIVEALCNVMLVGKVPPIIMTIKHNGKAAPCPVRIDKVHADATCSVALRNPVEARSWLNDALRRGYEIACGSKRDRVFMSVAAERRSMARRAEMNAWRAKRAAAKAAGQPDPDDEIPF